MSATAAAPQRPSVGAAALKDAALTALVALGLFAPIVGLRTDVGPAGWLVLRQRWDDVAILVSIAFLGRLALLAWRAWRGEPRPASAARAAALRKVGRLVAPVMLAVAVALPFIPGTGRYELDLGILVLTYVMLGWGLNIVVGLAGLLDLGYVAFYAVGAYSYALLATTFGLSFWICLPLAGILAAFWGVLLGFPVLRLRGDYLAIVTLGFGEVIRVLANNLDKPINITNGPQGITPIQRPDLPRFLIHPDFIAWLSDVAGRPINHANIYGFFFYLLALVILLFTLVQFRVFGRRSMIEY